MIVDVGHVVHAQAPAAEPRGRRRLRGRRRVRQELEGCVQTATPRSRRARRARSRTWPASSPAIPRRRTTRRTPLPGTLYNTERRRPSRSSTSRSTRRRTPTTRTTTRQRVDDRRGLEGRGPVLRSTPRNDNISPGGDQLDGRSASRRATSRSLFGVDRAAAPRNVARARIEIRPALSQKGFLPLAVPNTIVTKVQVRYFDECRDPGHNTPLLIRDLYAVPNTNTSQQGYAAQGGGTLWAPASASRRRRPSRWATRVGDRAHHARATSRAAADYLAVGQQVRLAGVDERDRPQPSRARR